MTRCAANTNPSAVTETQMSSHTEREMVAHFADKSSFDAAVAALREHGFRDSDLSVLATHDSIDAAGESGGSWRDALWALLGEWKVEVPLVASGAIVLGGGPAAIAVAGVVGAAVGGLAVKEVVDEVTAQPHSEEFARAVEAGNVVLWVRTPDPESQEHARGILEGCGGKDIHINESVRR